MRNPMQPITDKDGVPRFKENRIVRYLLDYGGINLNDLAAITFSQDDREQFAQLIGYSVRGFHELSYVSDETAEEASAKARQAGCVEAGHVAGCRDFGCEIHSGVARTGRGGR